MIPKISNPVKITIRKIITKKAINGASADAVSYESIPVGKVRFKDK